VIAIELTRSRGRADTIGVNCLSRAFLFGVLIVAATCTSAWALDSAIRGEVTDSSGGVLPGVVVVALAPDGREVGQTVTDEAGRYQFRVLPPGLVRLGFTLDGFEPSFVSVTLRAGNETHVVERLKLAKLSEEVIVYGKAPEPPLPPVVFEKEPEPVVVPVAREELETVCRPAKPGSSIGPFGTIVANRNSDGRGLYGRGEQLHITGGLTHGLEVGRNVTVIRYFHTERGGRPSIGEHTAGVIQIVAATADSARAIVVHACNELQPGDLLAAFLPLSLTRAAGAGTPEYDSAAKILFADSGVMLGAPGRLMVIDQGTKQGLFAGQRVTLFRRRPQSPAPVVLGEGVVIEVKAKSATIRIERATDAITAGDLAAPQR
jgi:hypothetical protein